MRVMAEEVKKGGLIQACKLWTITHDVGLGIFVWEHAIPSLPVCCGPTHPDEGNLPGGIFYHAIGKGSDPHGKVGRKSLGSMIIPYFHFPKLNHRCIVTIMSSTVFGRSGPTREEKRCPTWPRTSNTSSKKGWRPTCHPTLPRASRTPSSFANCSSAKWWPSRFRRNSWRRCQRCPSAAPHTGPVNARRLVPPLMMSKARLGYARPIRIELLTKYCLRTGDAVPPGLERSIRLKVSFE